MKRFITLLLAAFAMVAGLMTMTITPANAASPQITVAVDMPNSQINVTGSGWTGGDSITVYGTAWNRTIPDAPVSADQDGGFTLNIPFPPGPYDGGMIQIYGRDSQGAIAYNMAFSYPPASPMAVTESVSGDTRTFRVTDAVPGGPVTWEFTGAGTRTSTTTADAMGRAALTWAQAPTGVMYLRVTSGPRTAMYVTQNVTMNPQVPETVYASRGAYCSVSNYPGGFAFPGAVVTGLRNGTTATVVQYAYGQTAYRENLTADFNGNVTVPAMQLPPVVANTLTQKINPTTRVITGSKVDPALGLQIGGKVYPLVRPALAPEIGKAVRCTGQPIRAAAYVTAKSARAGTPGVLKVSVRSWQWSASANAYTPSGKATGKVRVYVNNKLKRSVSLAGGDGTVNVTSDLRKGKRSKIRFVYVGTGNTATGSKTLTVVRKK